MKGFRDGAEVWICDGCYAYVPPGTADWSEDHENGFPASPGLAQANRPSDPPRPVMQFAQPAHWCPKCAAPSNGHEPTATPPEILNAIKRNDNSDAT